MRLEISDDTRIQSDAGLKNTGFREEEPLRAGLRLDPHAGGEGSRFVSEPEDMEWYVVEDQKREVLIASLRPAASDAERAARTRLAEGARNLRNVTLGSWKVR